jgi:hypothetical protein
MNSGAPKNYRRSGSALTRGCVAAFGVCHPAGRARRSGGDLDRHHRAAPRDKDDTATSALKRADQALYRAKRDGRNRVVPDAA